MMIQCPEAGGIRVSVAEASGAVFLDILFRNQNLKRSKTYLRTACSYRVRSWFSMSGSVSALMLMQLVKRGSSSTTQKRAFYVAEQTQHPKTIMLLLTRSASSTAGGRVVVARVEQLETDFSCIRSHGNATGYNFLPEKLQIIQPVTETYLATKVRFFNIPISRHYVLHRFMRT